MYLLELGLSSIDNQNNFLFLESRVEPNPERLYLDDTDVLILHNPGKIADKAVEDIQSFLQRGGGVIWFAGNNQIENESIIIHLKDPGTPVLIKDISDKNSFHVVMPMKI